MRCFLFALAMSGCVSAQELVVNGGFDGGLDGWEDTVLGESLWVSSVGNSANGSVGFANADFLELSGVIFQDLDTVAGQQYQVQLYVRNDIDREDYLEIFWELESVYKEFPVRVTDGWQSLSLILTASNPPSSLDIFGADQLGLLYIDDVSVQPVSDQPPMLISVVSRKEHGTAMTAFDPQHGTVWPHPQVSPGLIGLGTNPPGFPWPHPPVDDERASGGD